MCVDDKNDSRMRENRETIGNASEYRLCIEPESLKYCSPNEFNKKVAALHSPMIPNFWMAIFVLLSKHRGAYESASNEETRNNRIFHLQSLTIAPDFPRYSNKNRFETPAAKILLRDSITPRGSNMSRDWSPLIKYIRNRSNDSLKPLEYCVIDFD